jgi:hypothetical protein
MPLQNIVCLIALASVLVKSCSKEPAINPKTSPPADAVDNNLVWKKLFEAALEGSPTLTSIDQINLNGEKANSTQKIYLQALQEFTSGNIKKARDLFGQLTPEELPPGFLYAPYRAYKIADPAESNPFKTPLLELANKKQLPSIWVARLKCDEGNFFESLTVYWRTNPKDWTLHDIDCLVQISSLQGTGPDLLSLARKSISSGLLDENVQLALSESILETETQYNAKVDQSLVGKLQTEINRNSAIGKAVEASIQQALNLRSLFINKEYQKILELTENKDPIRQSNETLLMIFLAASQQGDLQQCAKWSQEIKRRNKDQETEKWVEKIIKETEMSAPSSSSSLQ